MKTSVGHARAHPSDECVAFTKPTCIAKKIDPDALIEEVFIRPPQYLPPVLRLWTAHRPQLQWLRIDFPGTTNDISTHYSAVLGSSRMHLPAQNLSAF